jgi:hypothetical protein
MLNIFVTTTPFLNCRIYQPPNAYVWISGILLSNAMAAAAVKKIYIQENDQRDYVAFANRK